MDFENRGKARQLLEGSLGFKAAIATAGCAYLSTRSGSCRATFGSGFLLEIDSSVIASTGL